MKTQVKKYSRQNKGEAKNKPWPPQKNEWMEGRMLKRRTVDNVRETERESECDNANKHQV